MSLALPSRQVRCEGVFEFAELFELGFGFGEGRLGHGDNTAAGFLALAAQTDDAPDFIETEAERLRFANEAYLVQCGVAIDAVPARCSRWLREEPAPVIKSDRVGLYPRQLRPPV